MAVGLDDAPLGAKIAELQRRQLDYLQRCFTDCATGQLNLGTIHPMQAQRGLQHAFNELQFNPGRRAVQHRPDGGNGTAKFGMRGRRLGR